MGGGHGVHTNTTLSKCKYIDEVFNNKRCLYITYV